MWSFRQPYCPAFTRPHEVTWTLVLAEGKITAEEAERMLEALDRLSGGIRRS